VRTDWRAPGEKLLPVIGPCVSWLYLFMIACTGMVSASISEEMALLRSLLYLLAINDDTNLVSRGGLAGLEDVRIYARRMLLDGGVLAIDGLDRMQPLMKN
jgi:triphosphoribosyl-dephospho-CoA synthetase